MSEWEQEGLPQEGGGSESETEEEGGGEGWETEASPHEGEEGTEPA
jgi:hypothetical protein